MSPDGSVTHWINLLKKGDELAAQRPWEIYFQRLASLAWKKLQGSPRRVADEEDVALSAFKSLCLGAAHGRFPLLANRDNLWRLLVVITVRKAQDLANDCRRLKRGGPRIRGDPSETDLSSEGPAAIEQILSREPTPEFAALMEEEYQRLLDLLGDEMLRSIALLKMEGHTNEEIARKLDCVPRTIERKLGLIRSKWAGRAPSWTQRAGR